MQLLHIEYIEDEPDGLRYSAFCECYRKWLAARPVYMRQQHVAGEKSFLDYSGMKPSVTSPTTGERREVELFVAVLGASSYTYAEVTETQTLPDWVASNERSYRFFGGVTQLQVPDQLRSAVRKPCRYEPALNRTYLDLVRHYDTTALPARPRKPKDKAKVEVGVQVAQRWLLARIRNETFYSLEELNRRIWKLLGDLNERPMRHLGKSRRELFELLDKPALRPLPAEPFDYAEWAKARSNLDYHFEFEKHYYSVPYTLGRARLELRVTSQAIEVFHVGKRVAVHPRSFIKHGFTTCAEHMPESHRQQRDWEPDKILDWASRVGPFTCGLAERIFASRRHPEQGYRSCRGLQRLEKRVGPERLEAACKRAYVAGADSYRTVRRIIDNGLDRIVPDAEQEASEGEHIHHENIRGPEFYH